MDAERLKKQLEFIAEIDKIKKIYRNTLLMDGSRKENDAEHSWHMSVACIILSEYLDDKTIDISKSIQMAIIHDIVEIDAGDIFAYGKFDCEEKMKNERNAAIRIFGILPEDQKENFISLFDEFEKGESSEAIYAKAIDSFMPIFHNYMTKGIQWNRLNVTSEKVLVKNQHIKKASGALWSYVRFMVEDAVSKGYLRP